MTGMTALKSPWLIAFGVLSLVHLVLNGADVTPWDSITKCLLAPLLIGWVIEKDGPRLLAVALVFCFLGDLFLELDDLFIIGMAAFAVAHIAFITWFVRRGAIEQLKKKPIIAVVYIVAAIAMVAWCWGGLEDGLKAPIPVYAALLVGTASVSLAWDVRAGIGGAMFLISDGIIALSEADRIDKDATVTGLAIMALYILAIFFLTTAIVSRDRQSADTVPSRE